VDEVFFHIEFLLKCVEGAQTFRVGMFDSFRAACGAQSARSTGGASEACGVAFGNRFRTSAEGDLRNFLKKVS
jgi:hypothetical protein